MLSVVCFTALPTKQSYRRVRTIHELAPNLSQDPHFHSGQDGWPYAQ